MNIFDENAIIGRIRQVREQYAGSRGKSKFARAIGISPSTYSYYESNRLPPTDIMVRICELTGVHLDWLLRGEKTGPQDSGLANSRALQLDTPQPGGAKTSLLRKLDRLLTEHPDLAEPIDAFADLLADKRSLEGKTASNQQIASGLGRVGMAGKSQPARARPDWIPVLGRTAAGIVHFWPRDAVPSPAQALTELDQLVSEHIGKSILAAKDCVTALDMDASARAKGLDKQPANLIRVAGRSDSDVVEFVQNEQIYAMFPDSFALHIDGDSMSPRINDGDIVILSPSVPAVQGQIAVAHLAGQIGVTCKLMRTTDEAVHLIPINERYQTSVVQKKDLVWALAVLCHIRL